MPPHIVRYPPIQCNTRERCDQLQIPAPPPAWRVPEGPDNLAAAPMGGGRAWPGFEGKLHHTQRHKRRRCGGRRRVRRARLRHPWAAAGPGRASRGSSTTHSDTSDASVEGAEGSGGPGRASRSTTPSRRLVCGDLAGGRARRRQNTSGATSNKTARPGRRRARLRSPWAAAGLGRASRGSSTTHSDTSAAGAEGAGGSGRHGCGARGRWRGLAGLRDDAPSEARSADGSRAGRRPRAHQAARPSKAHHAGGRTRRCPEHQRRHKQRTPDTRKPRPADAGRGQPTQSGGRV